MEPEDEPGREASLEGSQEAGSPASCKPSGRRFRLSDYLAPIIMALCILVVSWLYFSKLAERSRQLREDPPRHRPGSSGGTGPAPVPPRPGGATPSSVEPAPARR